VRTLTPAEFDDLLAPSGTVAHSEHASPSHRRVVTTTTPFTPRLP
jgi:hypothetical protein